MGKILTIVFLSMSLWTLGQSSNTTAWKDDIAVLKAQMPLVHVHLFQNIDKDHYNKAFEKLEANIESLNNDQILVEVLRIIASVRDAHSAFNLPRAAASFRYFPLKLAVFNDGIFVTGINSENALAVGKRIKKLGKYDMDKAYKMIADLIPSDNDNPYHKKGFFPFMSINAQILHGLGIIDDTQALSLTVADRDGHEQLLSLNSGTIAEGMNVIFHTESGNDLPLYRQNRTKNYWLKVLEKEQLLYIGYNKAEQDPSQNVQAFSDSIRMLMQRFNITKTVVDVRDNEGGDMRTMAPFIRLLVSDERINSPGRLFVITGQRSASAASNFTNTIELNSNAILIGEPTPNSPNFLANPRPINLPNSKFQIQMSTIEAATGFPNDKRVWTTPHITVAITSEHYFSKKDPVLERILTLPIRQQQSVLIKELHGSYQLTPFQKVTIFADNGGVSRITISGGESAYEALPTFLKTVFVSVAGGKFQTAIPDVYLTKKNGKLFMHAKGNEPLELMKQTDHTVGPLQLIEQGKTAELKNLYANVKKMFPNYYYVAEGTLNTLVYTFLNEKKDLNTALLIAQLNTELYPDRHNPFDTLGEILVKAGKYKEAKKSYERALKIFPGLPSATKALEDLNHGL